MRKRIWAAWVVAALLGACGGDDTMTTAAEPSSANNEEPATVEPSAPEAPAPPGVASSEPCTRTVASGRPVPPAGFRAEDLIAMVPGPVDLGIDTDELTVDVVRHGYHGNAELEVIEVHAPTLCDDLERFGRITGFGRGFMSLEERPRRVVVSVHLFWDDQGAAMWTDAFVQGLQIGAGGPAGPTRVDVRPAEELGAGGLLLEHEGPEGVRTWAILQRGPIVGWVVDVHPGPATTVDVPATAQQLAARIEQVVADVGRRPDGGLDVTALLSAPLLQSELDERYADSEWDAFWGGCTDNEELGFIAEEASAALAERSGRLVGCTAMYRHEEMPWSGVSAFPDDASAAQYLRELPEALEGEAQTFEVTGLVHVDETSAVQLRQPGSSGETGAWHTRVAFRRGPYVGTVAVMRVGAEAEQRASVATMAVRLSQRLDHLLAGRAP